MELEAKFLWSVKIKTISSVGSKNIQLTLSVNTNSVVDFLKLVATKSISFEGRTSILIDSLFLHFCLSSKLKAIDRVPDLLLLVNISTLGIGSSST